MQNKEILCLKKIKKLLDDECELVNFLKKNNIELSKRLKTLIGYTEIQPSISKLKLIDCRKRKSDLVRVYGEITWLLHNNGKLSNINVDWLNGLIRVNLTRDVVNVVFEDEDYSSNQWSALLKKLKYKIKDCDREYSKLEKEFYNEQI